MLGRAGWTSLTFLALAVGAYAMLTYVVFDPRARPGDVSEAVFENPTGLYIHIGGSVIALVVGPMQFLLRRLTPLSRREAALPWHRWFGRVYVLGVLIGVSAGFYLALHTEGGVIANVGFATLAGLTLLTTGVAYARIRAGNEASHRRWMARSYALICAAITLRILLPLLEGAAGFDRAESYMAVAWASWIPNLVAVELILRRGRPSVGPSGALPSEGALSTN